MLHEPTIRQPMHKHHTESIANVVEYFSGRDDVIALLLTGSIAHGFARPASDVDVAIVVSETEYQRRKLVGELTYYDDRLCTYLGGYVDGKYIDIQFVRDVASHGSEPARFAFKDAQVLFSKTDGLATLVSQAARYPVDNKSEKILRFLAQFEAWNWYAQQALQTEDEYLLRLATTKLASFGCRLILAHNEILYPYHKWLTRVVQQAPSKPKDFEPLLAQLLASPKGSATSKFYEQIKGFTNWPETKLPWSMQFITDSELNWVSGHTPVDDL